MKTFGELVKEIRLAKGMLQQDLADKVDKSVAYISQIERTTSQTPPSEEVGRNIIEKLEVDAATRARLEKTLKKTIQEHKVERVYDSSLLLEEFFKDAKMSVEQVANRMIGKNGERRSRQIVQVWKNGLQLPTQEAIEGLTQVFQDAGISDERLKDYSRQHLYDSVYHNSTFSHFTEKQKRAIAEAAVRIAEE